MSNKGETCEEHADEQLTLNAKISVTGVWKEIIAQKQAKNPSTTTTKNPNNNNPKTKKPKK